MIWVDIFKLDTTVHKSGRELELNESFANALLRNFNRLTGEGAEIVVLREHERDGHVFGIVHALRVWRGEDGDYLQASMEFFREDDRVAFNGGMLRRFSPGFALNFEHPHTGELLGPTLLEVSFTSMPYQTNLRPPQKTNPGVRLALSFAGEIITTLKEEDTMETKTEAAKTVEATGAAEASAPTDFDERLDALKESILSEVKALLSPDPTPDPAPALSDQDRKLEELSAQVAKLEDEKTRLELSAAGIVEGVEALVSVKRTNPEAFGTMVDLARKGGPATQTPIGRPGTEKISDSITVAEVISLAQDAGYEYGNGPGFVLWVHRNHPEKVEEVLAAVRN